MTDDTEDTRIICEFMDRCPRSTTRSRDSDSGWWRLVGCVREDGEWIPNAIDLNRAHWVEERLTEEQWNRYINAFATPIDRRLRMFAWDRVSALLHATAADKIKALAAVLREAK